MLGFRSTILAAACLVRFVVLNERPHMALDGGVHFLRDAVGAKYRKFAQPRLGGVFFLAMARPDDLRDA